MSFKVKNLLPRTLFGRSLIILALPVLLIQVITTVVFFDRHWDRVTARLSFAVAGEMAVLAAQIEQDESPENIKHVTGMAAQHLQLIASFEPEGVLDPARPLHGRSSSIAKTLGAAINEQIRRPHTISFDRSEKWVEVSLQLERGLLRVSLPQRRLYSSSSYIFLLWMLCASLILLVIAVFFMRNQIRPIRRLAVVAERFGRGLDIPPSFKPEGAHEVRQAARAFIEMHERIKRQIQQRTTMLAGVSHDLRTPLTRMKLQVAMLGNSPDVEALKADIADMERMIGAYLDFARGEGGEPPERTDLKTVLERITGAARKHGKTVHLEIEGDLTLPLRPIAFERCLNNLVSNARKYADEIWITVRRIEEGIVIIIDDNGPGIPSDKREDVFKPFYRLEESRNIATGGVGLGLPIVQDIVHSHGGQIRLDQSPQGGLRVEIELPA